ncbi:MAG: DUF4912 domain-containing protein [Candidatus Margulisbacteria bacterium]|nr:DUF4912 domain-containing protein [Candidatus Margulisiibacteriota bacterium]
MIYEEEQLNKLTKFELLDIATELDVKYRTRMAKPKLVASILEEIAKKKKDFDPKTENILDEQEKSRQLDADSAKDREAVHASKYNKAEPKTKAAIKVEDKKEETVVEQPQENTYNKYDTMNDSYHVPHAYGDDKVIAMVVDPTHIHIYWETTQKTQQRLLQEAGLAGSGFDLLLKLYDVTDIDFNGANAWSEQELNVGYSRNWYFSVTANRSYCAEIGMKIHASGKFIRIARSNIIETPRDSVSDFYDEEWMMIDFNNNKNIYSELYRLSGGYDMKRYQLNSATVTERVDRPYDFKLPTVSLSSESLSSHSLSSHSLVKNQKDFWLWVDTELIVYGQTKVDAKELTINGEAIKLDKEGRFRLHMALPNGEYPFQVRAVSKCGEMVEEVTPKVIRFMEQEKVRTKG